MNQSARYEQIISEYFEADHAFRTKFASALARDEFVSLPPDVREARAFLECAEQSDVRALAVVAYEQAKAEREERWIAAHEDMYGIRSAARSR